MARSEHRRAAWFDDYVTTILQRDVRDLARIEGLAQLPNLLALLAARTSGLINYADVARDVGLPYASLHRYMGLLEATFLVEPLPAWSSNIGKRLTKASKMHFVDSGLASWLVGLDLRAGPAQALLFGQMLESFVVTELLKQIGWSVDAVKSYHFRNGTKEVDIVLERRDQRLVGVEVKSAGSVSSGDFVGLRALADLAGEHFHRGIVLYTGREALPFGERYFALPISALWELGARSNAAA